MSNEEYHGTPNCFSSSQIKTMLDDPELFYKKYITKEEPREETSSMHMGTYFHTAILEPHKLEKEVVVFTGRVRRGKEWEAFQEKNKGTPIISMSEKETCDVIVEAIRKSRIAMSLISKGECELSAFATIYVFEQEIYARGKVLSLNFGWVICDPELFKVVEAKGVKIQVRVRADLINLEENYILDLKSTNGNTKDEHSMKAVVSKWSYDLSAALYLDIFSIVTGNNYKHFYWSFASKDVGNSKTYLADKENIIIGRNKWVKAVVTLAFYLKNSWKFEDELGSLPPNFYEREWLKQEESIL